MSMSAEDQKKRERVSELRKAECERLSLLRRYPSEPPLDEKGVLLSNRIKEYCYKYYLIWPFDDERLRPAAYVLSVGENYSVQGRRGALSAGMSMTIEPYQVAIIETYETMNLPNFLIGRWNVQVKNAYRGLLWVGGAQVDPGFRGHLCCPIYNLSSEPLTLTFREKLAAIDFVTTTPYEKGGACKDFDWAGRPMIVFDEYPLLKSGIAEQVAEFKTTLDTEVKNAKDDTTRRLQNVDSRIDNFVTLTFAVVSVLFTGLGIVATAPSTERTIVNPPMLASAVALYFSLKNLSSSVGAAEKVERCFSHRAALAIATFVAVVGILWNIWTFRDSETEHKRAHDQAIEAANKEKRDRDEVIRQLRREFEAKVEGVVQQVKQSQPSPTQKR